MSEKKEILRILEDLQNLIDIQCSDGNWNVNPYMQGMANGLILAKSVITNETPEYVDAPDIWLDDINFIDKLVKSGIIVEKPTGE